jgi:hypothetical protein
MQATQHRSCNQRVLAVAAAELSALPVIVVIIHPLHAS